MEFEINDINEKLVKLRYDYAKKTRAFIKLVFDLPTCLYVTDLGVN